MLSPETGEYVNVVAVLADKANQLKELSSFLDAERDGEVLSVMCVYQQDILLWIKAFTDGDTNETSAREAVDDLYEGAMNFLQITGRSSMHHEPTPHVYVHSIHLMHPDY